MAVLSVTFWKYIASMNQISMHPHSKAQMAIYYDEYPNCCCMTVFHCIEQMSLSWEIKNEVT